MDVLDFVAGKTVAQRLLLDLLLLQVILEHAVRVGHRVGKVYLLLSLLELICKLHFEETARANVVRELALDV